MENCKDCIFYTPTISESDGVLPYGSCSSDDIEIYYNKETSYISPLTKAENWDTKAGENNSRLVVEYDEPRHTINFGENFGCVHFKQK
jgi:hypothetical protein